MTKANRWAWIISLVVVTGASLVLTFLLSITTNNRSFYEQHYEWLFWLNIVVAVLLVLVIGIAAVRMWLRVQRGKFGGRLLLKLAAIFALVGVLPGVLPALDALARAGLPLAVATSSARRGSTFGPKTGTKAALLARFAAVVCVDDDAMAGRPGKPAPDIFLVAAEALGVAGGAAACVVFEDSIAGVTAGVAAGAVVVAVPDARNREAAWAAGAHYVLRSLEDFTLDMIGLEEVEEESVVA